MRELRQHASRYLAVVKAGGTVEVTERGELVALVVPPSPGASARERLVAAGRLVPARAVFRPPSRRIAIGERRPASETLAELRGERLQ